MKKTTYFHKTIGLIATAYLLITSCSKFGDKSFLDATDTGQINNELTFSDSLMTLEFLNGIYRDISYTYYLDNGIYGGGLWSFSDASDDSENRWSGATAQAAPAINLAQFSGDADFSRFRNHWTYCYQNIYRANLFLANVDRSPLSPQKITRLKAEARFLRAVYMYHLLRNYGGVPLFKDRLFSITDDYAMARSSFDETEKYIEEELTAIAAILPVTYPQEDFGRPTRGAALAIKSKMLLLAASPLFNGENPGSGEAKKLAGYEGFDANRWKAAADAAKAVMDMNHYSLIEDNSKPGLGFYKATTTRVNGEIIFQIMMNTGRWNEGYLLPTSRGGQAYSYPTQQLVDAFPMSNGKLITEEGSGYNAANPYINRDPRFGYTILYNGSQWLDRTSNSLKPVNLYWQAAGDGLGTSGNTRTGYLFRKLCNENAGGNFGVTADVGLVVSRYAEILLNYAEAQNEFAGPSAEVYAAVEQVRKRAGLSPYQLSAGLTKEKMRTIIRNERRVELAFEEGHRFYDIKRWKTAENLINGEMKGMRWDLNGSTLTNSSFTFETRIFVNPKMYYFPIPQSEINKIPELLQNPGW